MESLAIYVTLGLLMGSQGLTFSNWQFWCYMGLFWAMDRHSSFVGAVQGIEASKEYIMRLQEELAQLKKKLDSGVNK